MREFTVFNSANGEVLRSQSTNVEVSEADVPLEAGESLVEGAYSSDAFYIGPNGVPVAKPNRPSGSHVFDYTTKTWVDPRTLDDLKALRWAELKFERTTDISSPLTTPYGVFDADEKSQKAITDAILLLQTIGPTGTIDFTLADNSTVTLTTAQMVNVGLLLGQKIQAAHTKGRVLRAQIEAATTKEDVEAVVW